MKTTNAKHIIVAALCVASFATADVVDTIFAKAKEAEDDGGVNFCGFYVGMSKADAETLVSHYRLKNGEFLIEGDPVYSINFSIKGVQRITKGGNSYDELCQAVAKRVGWMESKSDAGIFEDWDDLSWEEYNTIDGVRVTMSKSVHGCGKVGFTMFDVAATKAAEIKAREEREAAERRKREKEKQEALAWRSESKIISISNSVSIELKSVPGPLWFGKTEITQEQWETVMGTSCPIPLYDRSFIGSDLPAVCVSWHDCHQFLEKLNELPGVKDSGLLFRLPSPVEWRVACLAGSTGEYCMLVDGTEITKESLGQVAWFQVNSGDHPHPVGQKTPNAFGLHDMLGNVWEWTDGEWKTSSPENTVTCGGAYFNDSSWVSSDDWNREIPNKRTNRCLGFRICADRKPKKETGANSQNNRLELERDMGKTQEEGSVPEDVIVVDAVDIVVKCAGDQAKQQAMLEEVLTGREDISFVVMFKAADVQDGPYLCFDVEDLTKAFVSFYHDNMEAVLKEALLRTTKR